MGWAWRDGNLEALPAGGTWRLSPRLVVGAIENRVTRRARKPNHGRRPESTSWVLVVENRLDRLCPDGRHRPVPGRGRWPGPRPRTPPGGPAAPPRAGRR